MMFVVQAVGPIFLSNVSQEWERYW